MIRNDRDAFRRLLMAAAIPISSSATNETGGGQTVQLDHRTGELHDGVQSMQLFGFASAPNKGTDHFVVYLEGDRAKGVAVASNDQRVRPKGMVGGETQIYDASGQQIYLKTGTQIVINAKTSIIFMINGTQVGQLTSTSLAMSVPITSTGNITAGFGGSDQVDLLNHLHNVLNVLGGSSTRPTTIPTAGT